jgi:hypothetical protein
MVLITGSAIVMIARPVIFSVIAEAGGLLIHWCGALSRFGQFSIVQDPWNGLSTNKLDTSSKNCLSLLTHDPDAVLA